MKLSTVLIGLGVAIVTLFIIRAAWLESKGERGAIWNSQSKEVAYSLESDSVYLDLAGQSLGRIPPQVFSRVKLVELDLSGNELTAVPAEIGQLTRLRVLSLANNDITGLPAELGRLTDLEVLDLSTNPITGLPHELGSLQNLQTLDLRGTQYSQQDLSIIKESLSPEVHILTE